MQFCEKFLELFSTFSAFSAWCLQFERPQTWYRAMISSGNPYSSPQYFLPNKLAYVAAKTPKRNSQYPPPSTQASQSCISFCTWVYLTTDRFIALNGVICGSGYADTWVIINNSRCAWRTNAQGCASLEAVLVNINDSSIFVNFISDYIPIAFPKAGTLFLNCAVIKSGEFIGILQHFNYIWVWWWGIPAGESRRWHSKKRSWRWEKQQIHLQTTRIEKI